MATLGANTLYIYKDIITLDIRIQRLLGHNLKRGQLGQNFDQNLGQIFDQKLDQNLKRRQLNQSFDQSLVKFLIKHLIKILIKSSVKIFDQKLFRLYRVLSLSLTIVALSSTPPYFHHDIILAVKGEWKSERVRYAI